MGMTLYEIDGKLMEAFERAIDPETGEIIDDLAVEEIGKLQEDREEKIEGILLMIKNLESDAEQLKAEKQKFEQRQRTALNRAAWLRKYAETSLDGEKFKTARVSVSYRKSEAVEFTGNVYDLPGECLKYKAPDVDKTALKKLLKEGQEIPDAKIVCRMNMQIK